MLYIILAWLKKVYSLPKFIFKSRPRYLLDDWPESFFSDDFLRVKRINRDNNDVFIHCRCTSF